MSNNIQGIKPSSKNQETKQDEELNGTNFFFEEISQKLVNFDDLYNRYSNSNYKDEYNQKKSLSEIAVKFSNFNLYEKLFEEIYDWNTQKKQKSFNKLIKNIIEPFFERTIKLKDVKTNPAAVSNFDTERGKEQISSHIQNNKGENFFFDHLFLWSIFLYDWKKIHLKLIIREFWFTTQRPIDCILVAMIVYERFSELSFLSFEQKQKLIEAKKEFEKWACDFIELCESEDYFATQKNLLFQNDMFYGRTCIELAFEARAAKVLSSNVCVRLIEDLWYQKIYPDAPFHRNRFQCLIPLLWPLIFYKKYELFRNDIGGDEITLEDAVQEDSMAENTDHSNKVYMRFFYYYNSPVVKHINHTISFIAFNLLLAYMVFFNYYPYKNQITDYSYPHYGVSASEIFLIVWMCSLSIEFFVNFLNAPSYSQNFTKKIKSKLAFIFKNNWNYYDIIILLVFYFGLSVRFVQSSRKSCFTKNQEESCFEVARVAYCLLLLLSCIKIFRYINVMSKSCQAKFYMLCAMAFELIYYLSFILIIMSSYAIVFSSIIKKTQDFDYYSFSRNFYSVFWSIFLQKDDALTQIDNFTCTKNNTYYENWSDCNHNLSTHFLYYTFTAFIIACNLLLLNLVIAIFNFNIEYINKKKEKTIFINSFNKYNALYITILPPPLNLIEYILRSFLRIYENSVNFRFDQSIKTSFPYKKNDENFENDNDNTNDEKKLDISIRDKSESLIIFDLDIIKNKDKEYRENEREREIEREKKRKRAIYEFQKKYIAIFRKKIKINEKIESKEIHEEIEEYEKQTRDGRNQNNQNEKNLNKRQQKLIEEYKKCLNEYLYLSSND